jgi:dipeptidyl aminopeptidase/acylaminoacyl peptidase
VQAKLRGRRLWIYPSILVGICTLCGCGSGGGGPVPPKPPPGAHTLEAVSYDRLGVGKIVFHRADFSGAGWRDGVYMIDPVTRTSSFEFDVGGGWDVSPDGLMIAYIRVTDKNTLSDVYVANLDGSAERQASAFPAPEGPPSWTPDGRYIIFDAAGTDYNYNLYRQPPVLPTASELVQITNFPNTTACPTLAGPPAVERVSISPSGQIVWICGGGTIEVTAPDGSTTTAIYALPPTAPRFTELHASSWSPDGQRIAFLVLIRASLNGEIGERQQMLLKVLDAQGQNESVLATVASSGLQDPGGLTDIYSLCWANDGSRVFFNVADGNTQAHIWIVNADGSGLMQVTNAPMVWDHDISCSR